MNYPNLRRRLKRERERERENERERESKSVYSSERLHVCISVCVRGCKGLNSICVLFVCVVGLCRRWFCEYVILGWLLYCVCVSVCVCVCVCVWSVRSGERRGVR